MAIPDFPGNSKHPSERKISKPDIKQVATGKVIKRKQSVGSKIKDAFIGDHDGSVMNYLIVDVIIPATKNIIADVVTGGIEMLLWSGKRTYSDSRGYNKGRNYVSYNGYYQGGTTSNAIPSVNSARPYGRFDDIILDTRPQCEEIISMLIDLTNDYGAASVADLNQMIGISGAFTDNKFGWTDLSSADVKRVSEGYLLILPRAIPLD